MADGRTVTSFSSDAFAAHAVELAREGESRFRLLVEHSSDGLYLVAPDGQVSYASPPVERLLGYERRELTGRHFLDYLHPDDRDHAGWFFADLLSKPSRCAPATAACTATASSGTSKWSASTAWPRSRSRRSSSTSAT
jgi:PAS domain S-box-containing protein